MNKKLIGFDDNLLAEIEDYSNRRGFTFTEAVRSLIAHGIASENKDTPTQPEGDSIDFPSLVHMVEELSVEVNKIKGDNSWWNTDDIQSRVGNLELFQKTSEKKINILTSTAKLFKGHLKDRTIHLQD